MEQERRLAGTLTRPNRLVEAVLAGAAFDKAIVLEATAWGNALWQARNAWDIDQHRLPDEADDWLRGGAWAKRRLSKSDAAELLGMAFSAIEGAGK